MREILFKAKRKDNGEWVEGIPIKTKIGYFMCYDENPHYCSLYGYMEIDDIVMIDENTLCQYTGLTDKNGKRIWENDIVRCKKSIDGNLIDYCIEYGYVEMKHGAFGLHRKQGYYRPFKDWLEDYEYEVIGNIFDNAELLEVE